MFSSKTQITVRYAETDPMGYAYYAHYATWLEVARVEALKRINIRYKELEEQGILLPVIEYRIRFFKPALYDQPLTIITNIPQMPKARIQFNYNTYDTEERLLNEAFTILAFINKKTSKPCPAPRTVVDGLAPYFET